MAIDTTQLTDYSWSDIAVAAKMAMLSGALGGASLSIAGRTIGRYSIQELKTLYSFAIEMANAEANSETGGNIVLARFGEQA